MKTRAVVNDLCFVIIALALAGGISVSLESLQLSRDLFGASAIVLFAFGLLTICCGGSIATWGLVLLVFSMAALFRVQAVDFGGVLFIWAFATLTLVVIACAVWPVAEEFANAPSDNSFPPFV